MNKKQSIIDYYNGISIYSMMHDYIENNETFDFSEISDETLIYAKSALIANFFLLKKEDIVEKEAGLKFKSKLIDAELEKTVNIIATKVGDEYQIGHFKADAPTIIATIRNKFAHGDYYVDAKNNNIVINKDNMPLEINIDKLIFCIIRAIYSYIGFPKTPVVTRQLVESICPKVYNDKPITNASELKETLKYCKIVELKFRSLNGTNLTEEQLECFNKFVHNYYIYQNDRNIFSYLKNQFDILAKKDELVLDITRSKIKKEDTPDKLVNYFSDCSQFYELDLFSQIYIINNNLLKLECPDYNPETYLFSNIVNLEILQKLSNEKKTNRKRMFEKFSDAQKNMINANISSMFIINDIARFTTLFSYPLDDIYSPEKYKTERTDELDYSKLDLNFINPDVLEINDDPLEQIKNQLNASNNEILRKKKSYEKECNDYEMFKDRLPENAKEIKKNIIEKKKQNIVNETEKNKLLQIKYNLVNNDFTNNSLYFRNRAIIEGIRNAISHGCIEINDLNSSIPCKNLITFTNEYNGKIFLKLTISLEEFQQIFNEQNRTVIYNFLNPKFKLFNKIKKLIQH